MDIEQSLLKVETWKRFTNCKKIPIKNKFYFSFPRIYSFVGPINPKKPSQGLSLQLWYLKRLGLFPPETDSKFVKMLYELWSILNRILFLHLLTVTEIMFILEVQDLLVSLLMQIVCITMSSAPTSQGAVDGLFVLLTQICINYKVEMFYSNRYRIRACVKMLDSQHFQPKSEDEDK